VPPRSWICGIMHVSCRTRSRLERLPARQRAWLVRSEALWREAHAIVAANPALDPGDVYHALVALDLPPGERLRRGLTRVRYRPHSG
jgi:hypothetical protein